MHTKIIHAYYRLTGALQALAVFPTLLNTLVYLYAYARAYTRTRGSVRVRMGVVGILTGVSLLLTPLLAHAAVQGYATKDTGITKGMAVALSTEQPTSNGVAYIERATVDNASRTLGVVVDPTTDTTAISASGDQLYVANTGEATVFVTDLNGTVQKGDLLAPSPVAGVLMRAEDDSKGVLGVAQSDFSTNDAQSVSLQAPRGTDQAKVGSVRINMDVRFTVNNTGVAKTFLQKSGEALVKHEVSSVQAIIASVILALLIVVVGGIMYAAISSSIVSLGRNPLAKKTILNGMGQVIILIVGVLILGFAAIYLVLWV